MIGAAPVLVGRLAEVAAHEGESGPPAWALGLSTLAIFFVLLLAVTRFNRDR
jgi:hypothetical protein